MGKRKCITQCLMLYFLLSHHLTQAQEQTVGLFFNDSEAFNGYTIFAPIRYTTTYLIDNDGRLVHSWESDYHPGQSVYLLENGHLLRTAKVDDHYRFNAGGYGGRVQEFTWDGTLMWEYVYADSLVIQHHDIEPLPNGNVLLIAWECKTAAEAIAAGRDTNLLNDDELWPDHIVEVEAYGISDGTIVWDYINPVTDKGPVMQGEPVIVGPNKEKHINPVFHITRYTGEFPGLVDKDLTPGDPVEKYPTGIDKPNENNASRFSLNHNYPNPFNTSTAISYQLSAFSQKQVASSQKPVRGKLDSKFKSLY